MACDVGAVARQPSFVMDPVLSFEPHRRHLRGLAYRMLGSIAEAEDAVQDAYLRWHAVDRDQVTDPRAYLTTPRRESVWTPCDRRASAARNMSDRGCPSP